MPVALPDLDTLDAVTLREIVVKQQAQISSRDEELERLQVQISSHDAELERLRLMIARLQRLQFGRKSEKIQREIEQLELQLEDLEEGAAEKKRRAGRTLPAPAATISSIYLHLSERHLKAAGTPIDKAEFSEPKQVKRSRKLHKR